MQQFMKQLQRHVSKPESLLASTTLSNLMKNKLHVAWKQISNPFVLNLDPDFRPLEIKHPDYNVLEFKTSVFPGGEQHFQITNGEYPGDLIITQRYNSAADLMLIILANDAAKRMGFTNIQLVLPYFPGARQDRVCNTGEALTVKVFVDLINSCGFDRVFIYSPHSEVTPAVINNCEIIDLDSYYLEKILREQCPGQSDSIVNIVCPDAGAGKRVANLAKAMAKLYPQNTINLIRCEKVRDVASGELKEFFCASDDLGGFVTIIADDICSYGGTFKGLGEVLKKKNCGKLILFTSHADCVQGLQNMVEYFDHVYTSNSKQNWNQYKYTLDNKLTCFGINL